MFPYRSSVSAIFQGKFYLSPSIVCIQFLPLPVRWVFYEVIKISRIIFWLYFTFIGPCFLRAWDMTLARQVAVEGVMLETSWLVMFERGKKPWNVPSSSLYLHHLNLDQFEIEMYERKWELQKKYIGPFICPEDSNLILVNKFSLTV